MWLDLALYISELRGCPRRSIGCNGHNPTSTDDAVTLIVGCASNRARVSRLNVLRTVRLMVPPQRGTWEAPFLIRNDIKYKRHQATAGVIHFIFTIIYNPHLLTRRAAARDTLRKR